MSQDQPKISVIIPVYNVENYLRECLDSVVNQTLKDIEIICVDDGSTDGSLTILREYEAKDARFHVLTQNNRYAGVARNRGMEQAKGQYYMFLDADDFFEADMLEKMYVQASTYDADICLCGADSYDINQKKYSPMSWCLNLKNIKTQPFCSADTANIFAVTNPAPWNKLISAEFIRQHNLQFQDTPHNNDIYFVYCAIALAEKIVYVNEAFVHYRIGQRTNLQSGLSKNPTVICEALRAIKQRLEAESCWEYVADSFLNTASENLEYTLRRVEEFPDAKKQLLEALNDKYFQEFGLQDCPIEKIVGRKRYNHLYFELLRIDNDDPRAPQVSIVVPVYNVEKYVAKCMDSLIAQTLENIEIICVDDASTDKSCAILRNYAERDKRVWLIEKDTNEGCVCARRTGSYAARGKYIMFVDPDDYLDLSACETAYGEITRKKVDVLQFTCGVEDYDNNDETKRWLENYLRAKDQILNQKELQNGLFIKRDVATALVGKIYHASSCKLAYRNMPDIYCNMGEDLFQQFYFSCFVDSYAGVGTKPLYWYRRGLGITNSRDIDLNKYEKSCKMAILYEHMAHFAQHIQKDSYLLKCADALGTRMCEDCVRKWRDQIPENKKGETFKLFWRYWSAFPGLDEVITRMTGKQPETLYRAYMTIKKYIKLAARYEEDTDWKPMVSVIIPIYDVEEYLRECLDSIVNQTLENIEIICVNDGSPDDSLSIAEEYQKKDPRITVISQANGGLSAARNIGMHFAHGKYIYFLDSDDYIDVTALEELTQLAERENLDVLRFGIKAFYSSDQLKNTHSFEYYNIGEADITEAISGVEYLNDRKEKGKYIPSVCISLLRSSFIRENKIIFRDGIIHEDNLFSFLVFMAAKRVMEVSDSIYHRRVREASIMTNTKTAKNVIGFFSCAMGVLEYALNNENDLLKEKEIKREYNSMLNAARQDYEAISLQERKKVVFASEIENELFKQLVAYGGAFIKTQNELKETRGALDAINKSVSFRVGRAITWFPRKVRGGVRCYQEHGPAYTFDRTLYHMHLQWLPSKVSGGIQCFQDHGAGYTVRRTLYHIGLWEDEEEPKSPENRPKLVKHAERILHKKKSK